MFERHPRIQKVWLRLVKLMLGAGLRLKIIPHEYQGLCGRLHDWISNGVLDGQPHGFHRAMVIETASICNAACSFCSYPLLEFPRKVMTEKTFDAALAEARRLRVPDVDFTPFLGEAFVDPQFIPRIRKARQELPTTTLAITTNGTLFTRFDVEAFLTSGISRINVSFGAWGKEDYLKLYNIDAWEKVHAGVSALLAAKAKLKSDVYVALWYRTLNAEKVRHHPENLALQEKFKHVINETLYTDVFHDIQAISGQQPKFIQLERHFDASAIKKSPCAHLGKVACSSTGKWFGCYCAASDCHRQEQSWFYLGENGDAAPDLNRALEEKVRQWRAGQLPDCCRTCPVYIPANKPGDAIAYAPGDQKNSLEPVTKNDSGVLR